MYTITDNKGKELKQFNHPDKATKWLLDNDKADSETLVTIGGMPEPVTMKAFDLVNLVHSIDKAATKLGHTKPQAK